MKLHDDDLERALDSARTASGVSSAPIYHRVLIIGAGFGGLALALALQRNRTRDYHILERSHDIGGVWRDNSYPGAACDVVSIFYSLSIHQRYPWSGPFGKRDEILHHINQVADRYELRKHITFHQEVASAAFDEARGLWRVTTKDDVSYECSILISAVGLFNRPFVPAIPGRDTFQGAQFHSANWDHSFDFQDKTVAVIGNGASCVQFLPRVAPLARQVFLFQRTPQYVLPKRVHPGTGPITNAIARIPALRKLARASVFLQFERMMYRRLNRPELRAGNEALYRQVLEEKIRDPELRRKLTPDYAIGCKRILVSDEWFDTLARPNVSVIDTAIQEIKENAVVTRDHASYQVDAIVWGTGFTATDYLQPMKVSGLSADLQTKWQHGAEAYLGITVPDFPNFFMLYGPNTNATSSIVFMLECQAHYIASAIKLLERRNARWMNVKPERFRTFSDSVQERLSKTVAADANCFTYMKTAEGRLTTNWPGYATEYWRLTRAARANDYTFHG